MRDFTNLIREARTENERSAVFSFRYRVYIEEMGKPYASADHENKSLTDKLDDTATILFVEMNNEIAGTVRINWGSVESSYAAFDNEAFAISKFDRFAKHAFSFNSRLSVSPQYRRSALALNLATHSYQLGLKRRVLLNFISCRPELTRFFERLGFRRYTDMFFDKDAGSQVPLVLALEDVEHLKSVKSPFLSALNQEGRRLETRPFFVPVSI